MSAENPNFTVTSKDTKTETLIERLHGLDPDAEDTGLESVQLLLAYIGDPDVTATFNAVNAW